MARNRGDKGANAGGRAKQSLAEATAKNERLAIFVAELKVNGGSIPEAEKSAGYSRGYGYTIKQRYPEVAGLLEEHHQEVIESVVDRWKDGHLDAIRVHYDIMMDTKAPPNVRLEAAKNWIDRVEGRAPQALDVNLVASREDEKASVTYRFAWAVHVSRGWELARAIAWALQNPEIVDGWARKHLQGGGG